MHPPDVTNPQKVRTRLAAFGNSGIVTPTTRKRGWFFLIQLQYDLSVLIYYRLCSCSAGPTCSSRTHSGVDLPSDFPMSSTCNHCFFFLLLSLLPISHPKSLASSPYLSPSTFSTDYSRMLKTLKIFAYPSPKHSSPPLPSPLSTFHARLFNSTFLTPHPHRAHLFYVSLPSDSTPRSVARSIRDLRSDFPFWNQTLGADHFYLSCAGIRIDSDRNLVELKKNSIQVSCFPAAEGGFIPHKDISLPPVIDACQPSVESTERKFLGLFYGEETSRISTVVDELRGDTKFLIESQPLDPGNLTGILGKTRFCLFFYGANKHLDLGQALRCGCVPVVISDRPILDLPFSDVLRWAEMAVFVGMQGGGKEVKRVLETTSGDKYERLQKAGKLGSVHFSWESKSSGYDAFHAALYQLWKRRHAVRYARSVSM